MLGSVFHKLYGPVVVEDRLPVSPQEAYEVISAPETYPDWLVGAQRIRSIDPDFPHPGSRFEHTVGLAEPATIDDHTDSLEAEPDRRLALQVHAGLFHARVDFELEPVGATTTKITLSEQPTGPVALLTPLLRPTLAGRNKRSLQRLKERLEHHAVS